MLCIQLAKSQVYFKSFALRYVTYATSMLELGDIHYTDMYIYYFYFFICYTQRAIGAFISPTSSSSTIGTKFPSDRGKIIFRKLKIKISSFFVYFIEKLNDWNKITTR